MSIMNVSERISVPAPPDEVWSYLIRPELVVSCLPGASLESSSEDGRHHSGSVLVKLGAFSLTYRGDAEFVEVDHDSRRLTVEGKGREKAGTGNVSMTIVTQVHAADGGSEVQVDADMQLAGKIVSFGRGMAEAVAEQVLSAFAQCLRTRVTDGGEGGAAEGAGAAPGPGGEGEATDPDSPASDEGAGQAAPGATAVGPGGPGASEEAHPPPAGAAASATDTPPGGFGLILRAFFVWLGRLAGIGRK